MTPKAYRRPSLQRPALSNPPQNCPEGSLLWRALLLRPEASSSAAPAPRARASPTPRVHGSAGRRSRSPQAYSSLSSCWCHSPECLPKTCVQGPAELSDPPEPRIRHSQRPPQDRGRGSFGRRGPWLGRVHDLVLLRRRRSASAARLGAARRPLHPRLRSRAQTPGPAAARRPPRSCWRSTHFSSAAPRRRPRRAPRRAQPSRRQASSRLERALAPPTTPDPFPAPKCRTSATSVSWRLQARQSMTRTCAAHTRSDPEPSKSAPQQTPCRGHRRCHSRTASVLRPIMARHPPGRHATGPLKQATSARHRFQACCETAITLEVGRRAVSCTTRPTNQQHLGPIGSAPSPSAPHANQRLQRRRA
mmetsp:Transcript_31679/g.105004  ORF Transcript_31679/g.105004 Transcript_31679/m.105004 type:complete len:362 (+) Transcript_31679:384-1469(+)